MDAALVDIGAGAIAQFANSKYYDKVYDRIPNPKKRWSKLRQRRKSAGQVDHIRPQDEPTTGQQNYGYDGHYDDGYDYDYDYGYGDSRGQRGRSRREQNRVDRYDRYSTDGRPQDYYRDAPRSYRDNRQSQELIPYRPLPPRTEYSRRALSVSGLQGGRAPFTQTDDYSEDEDEISRSRRDFTRAFVETEAFNDPDPDGPSTPSEAYSGRRSSSIHSRASRRSHAQDTYEVVRFRNRRGTYEYPPGQDLPATGGLKSTDEYVPPPYPYSRTARAYPNQESAAPLPIQMARAEGHRGSYSARDAYSNAPSYNREPRRHDSVRSSTSRRRRRSKSPHGTGVASAAMGALAGGFLGTELTKGDTLATVAAAVVGAVGAHEAERKYDRFEQKRQVRNERSNYDDDDYYYERRRRRSR
ncbi:tata-binding protein-associated factor 2n isoform 1 [Diplodia corticola]|uniref:Tata-binding protein-associated factor 2n isoform 1 n=1 Tax=Diplodia corticola TaxID=236234 RepID=A0A1J9SL44_9PEZI|nr:tata-binding protein-associated factor 2n isoform 1 [Diplodia corticola]OJD40444.1 tata-binding protein-associated factor 2n isoform 1 [Diplodia corticola]